MARLNLTLSDQMLERFRDEIYHRYGLRKGDLQKAAQEAIQMWTELPSTRDPASLRIYREAGLVDKQGKLTVLGRKVFGNSSVFISFLKELIHRNPDLVTKVLVEVLSQEFPEEFVQE